MALKPPVEVPQGAIRLNTDSQKLEFFAQDQWWEMATHNINLGGNGNASTDPTGNSAEQAAGTRGIFGGGYGSAPHQHMNRIDYITVETQGNSVEFGDMITARSAKTGGASRTRGLFQGGRFSPTSDGYNTIDYITFSSTGNTTSFGELSERNPGMQGVSNQTRSIFAGGYTMPGQTYVNTMEYVTIASTGNAKNFGDIDYSGAIHRHSNSGSSTTRGIWAGGRNNSTWFSEIFYKEIASLGNAQEFGDLTEDKANAANSMTSSTRMVCTGGTLAPSSSTTQMDYIEFATKGNAVRFGDQSFANQAVVGVSSKVRGVLFVGSADYPQTNNTLEYITIATQGDATDFGDLEQKHRHHSGFSNGHGGV